uniref:Adenine-specific DNA-methyltransferase n=1 Tax=Candidatus Kentrum sp. FW TaxID=2126338 RepID=A0A450RVV5_9GAMM|nr:MAG: adenine-specific DNA-methyltransferase [Candidatus Kentron sp. FW]
MECEDYADSLTAERVRRVIHGYEYQGTQKEELLREKITWSNLSKNTARNKLLDQVRSLENLESMRFDDIKKTIKDGELIVTGETKITERVEGLGGGFTYYTLGDPLDLDRMLTGESLPDYASIGAWLFHTATGEPLDPKGIREEESYLGESAGFHVWLIYQPELDFLKSRDAALTLSFAERISERKDKRHLVFAPARFVPNKMLLPLGVEHAPLPFALYRFEKE